MFNMPSAGSFEERGGWVVRQLCADLNITPNQAAGIVGNLGFESIGFKTLQEIKPLVSGSRGGYGWAQWTGPRRRAFEAYCAEHGLRPASDEANYGFLIEELRDTQAYSLAKVRLTNTLEAAVFTFGYHFEKPGGTTRTHLPGYEGRLKYARRALAGSRMSVPSHLTPVLAEAMTEISQPRTADMPIVPSRGPLMPSEPTPATPVAQTASTPYNAFQSLQNAIRRWLGF